MSIVWVRLRFDVAITASMVSISTACFASKAVKHERIDRILRGSRCAVRALRRINGH